MERTDPHTRKRKVAITAPLSDANRTHPRVLCVYEGNARCEGFPWSRVGPLGSQPSELDDGERETKFDQGATMNRGGLSSTSAGQPFSAAQLPQLEQLAVTLYTSPSQAERSHADQALKPFSSSPEYMVHCMTILDNSSSPYAQVFAASSMLKLVTEHGIALSSRVDARAYFLRYLAERGPGLEHYVITAMLQLLCRMSKLGWFDDESMRLVADEGKAFLEMYTKEEDTARASVLYFIGLKMLTTAVSEMNTPIPGRTLTQHRKTAVSFRERSLFGIFETSLRSLQYLKVHQHQQAMEQAMSLALACLSFDFVGTCIDDSTEDVGTIQIPSSWRSRIEDPETLEIFFEYYRNSQTPLSNTCLECLVKMASVRRSLFSSEVERISFLGRLIRGTKDVLSSQQGLQHHENYHEFCRLLGRLKTNYQLSELVGLEVYPEWTTLVADFTIESLKSWQWASSSVYYLLGLWSRLVSSVPYLKGDKPSLLETQVPRIVQAYIVSRMAAPEALEEEENLEDQLDSLPYLCRFKYEGTAEFLMQWLDPCIAKFQAGEDINLVESQLTWLVHIVSAVIRGRVSSSGSEPYEHMDGDLIARIFTIMRVSEANAMHAQRFSFRSKQLLELALISFMQSLRRAYIGEQVVSSSRVYTRLKEHLGIDDHVAVMDTLLGKICFNLKVYGSCEDIIDATLGLFQDLAAGYMSGKTLLKLDAVSMLLRCHDGRFFKFLECKPGRARTTYYLTLGKLLFMEEKPGAFEAFVDPFDQVLRGIASARTAAVSVQALKGAVHQDMVVGLFRDLRGLVAATTNRRTYGMVFEWLYPQHMPTVITCLETWADVPDVANAILKFFAEFVHNKTQRLTFDSSSANGILLFREVSKALCGYGGRVLEQSTMVPSDPYSQRYKGIWICLLVLSRALSGNYVNFGVFSLYNDPALVNALDVCLRMVFTISTHDILAYRKVSKSYYAFIDALCHNFVPEIARRDDAILVSIMTTLDSGLKSFDVAISSQCASSIDNLAGYYFKHKADGVKPNETGAQLSAHLAKHPDLLPRLLRTLLETVLFEECSNQWSLSRPLLTLILCTEPIYAGIREQVILTQPADGRHATSAALDRLMENVNRTLDAKNRDRFTQNVTLVRHELKSKAAVTN